MRVKLADAFELQMGKTPDRSDASCWNGAHKWVSIADLTKAGKCITETKETISDLGVSKSGIKRVPKGTVIMSFKLSIGKTAITTEDLYTNEAIMAFIDKGIYDIDTDYIYHLFASKDWSDGTNKAVLGLTLNKATLSQIEIEIPSITEQKQAVVVLDKVDELISLRKKQLQKLDDLIKSRFVEMFGDPVKNNLHLSTISMNEVCEIIDGDRGEHYPKQEDFYSNEYCLFLNAKNVTKNGFDFSNCMYITKEKDQQLRKGKLKRGDIVLTTRGTIGNLAYYSDDVQFENIRINSGMVLLRMKNKILERFFIEQFRMLLEEVKRTIASGSAQPQLPISTMNKIKLIVPELARQKQYVDALETINNARLIVQQGLERLEQMKQALMQKYFG